MSSVTKMLAAGGLKDPSGPPFKIYSRVVLFSAITVLDSVRRIRSIVKGGLGAWNTNFTCLP